MLGPRAKLVLRVVAAQKVMWGVLAPSVALATRDPRENAVFLALLAYWARRAKLANVVAEATRAS